MRIYGEVRILVGGEFSGTGTKDTCIRGRKKMAWFFKKKQ